MYLFHTVIPQIPKVLDPNHVLLIREKYITCWQNFLPAPFHLNKTEKSLKLW